MNFEQTYRSMQTPITPSDALVSDTLSRMHQRQRPKRRLRRGIAVALVAAVALGGTAAALQATGQLPALYTAVSRFLSPVKQACTEQGITMQVESAYLEGHTACVVFTVQDTQGDRLAADDLLLDGYRIDGWTMGSGSYRLLDWDEKTQTATFFAEFSVLNRTLDAAEPLTFSVDTLTPVLSSYDGEKLPVSLSNLPGSAAVQSHVLSDCFLPDGGEAPESYAFLAPQTPLWQSEDGLFSVSAVYQNGQLHLQLRTEQADGANGILELLDADGQPVAAHASYSYSDSGLYCREAIYAIQPDVLSGCTPVLYGSVDGTAIQGGWRVTFQLDG
ncbi:hypothetical protein [Agathobaculum sp. Marseille-P7918]|uniref:hypothetical protein n=1 Tax=Agathobaculum sp. Marseille-P7918 TaxID=2479843 RepID=UPI000F643A6B|nr:hypothetical protein [Agathobaculum sp. Marseille-P7918]